MKRYFKYYQNQMMAPLQITLDKKKILCLGFSMGFFINKIFFFIADGLHVTSYVVRPSLHALSMCPLISNQF